MFLLNISGLKKMRKICAALNDSSMENAAVQGLPPLASMLKMKFAQLSSVDVERSFSKRKAILRPNRQRFLVENLEQHALINHYFGLKDSLSDEDDPNV